MVARSLYSEANEDVLDAGGGLYQRKFSSGAGTLTQGADSVPTTTAGNAASAFAYVYNAVTGAWDRARGDTSAQFFKAPVQIKANRSITTSAASQQAAAQNTARTRLVICNIDATNAAYYNFGAAATVGSGSMRIGPNEYRIIEGTYEALNVIAGAGTPILSIWEY